MASRSGFRKVTLATTLDLCSRKNIAVDFTPPAFLSISEIDKLVGQEKSTPARSHRTALVFALTSALAKFIQALKYSKADLWKIFKIFLDIKG